MRQHVRRVGPAPRYLGHHADISRTQLLATRCGRWVEASAVWETPKRWREHAADPGFPFPKCKGCFRLASLRTVAALYVLPDGPYAGREDVDFWPEARDARLYAGPHPVVAHPPCARWGRYAEGGPSAPRTRKVGDDGGCFAAALLAVRTWGGVLEHPEASHAWPWFGLHRPPRHGGWVPADLLGGWTCCVEQGHYGHPGAKATWLYVFGIPCRELPELTWGRSGKRLRLDAGFHSKEERARTVKTGVCQRLSARQRALTPEPFATLLLDLARQTSRTLTL